MDYSDFNPNTLVSVRLWYINAAANSEKSIMKGK